jgi:hypothetical protein
MVNGAEQGILVRSAQQLLAKDNAMAGGTDEARESDKVSIYFRTHLGAYLGKQCGPLAVALSLSHVRSFYPTKSNALVVRFAFQ